MFLVDESFLPLRYFCSVFILLSLWTKQRLINNSRFDVEYIEHQKTDSLSLGCHHFEVGGGGSRIFKREAF